MTRGLMNEQIFVLFFLLYLLLFLFIFLANMQFLLRKDFLVALLDPASQTSQRIVTVSRTVQRGISKSVEPFYNPFLVFAKIKW